MNGRTFAFAVLALLLTVLLTVTGQAAEPAVSSGPQPATSAGPQIIGVQVGLAGRYRTGVWTPVEVTLRGGEQPSEGQVSVTVPDSDGAPNRLTTPEKQPVRLAAGETVTVPLYTRFGRTDSRMIVEFLPDPGPAVRRVFQAAATPGEGQFPRALPSTARLIGVLGANPTAVESALDLLRQQPGEQAAAVRFEQATSLPRQWYGYESLDALVLTTSQPELFADLKADGAEIIALDKWIRMGGRLVLAVGSQAERVLAAGAPLARFSPGTLRRTELLPSTAALESFVNSSVPVPEGPKLRVPLLQDLQGIVELRGENLPLVIRRPWGLGQVIFVAVDLDAAPLTDWPNRGLLVSRLLDLPVAAPGVRDEPAAVMHYGFTDISGQLRSALDQYAGVWPVPFSLVAGLVILYVALIGPVDYFLLRKLSPKMELTWLSFPLLVLAFGVAAYLLAHRLKGDEVRANQISLIDIDAESHWLRGTSWANVFSPRMEQYDLSCRTLPLGQQTPRGEELLFGWHGLPGGALGGMDGGTANPTSLEQPYQTAATLNALRGVPIPVWASKSFAARWSATMPLCPEADFRDRDQTLGGRVINTLDFPLRDCLLVYGRWVYELGTLEPGQVTQLGSVTSRRELKTLLTGQHLVFGEMSGKSQQETVPYDRASVDLGYVLRMMMFFEAGGGRRYTGLVNRYQSFVDLSSLLKTNRAILVGTAPASPAKAPQHGALLLREGKPVAADQDQQITVYRFVYPVTQGP